jgi:Zn-dependent M16 (insulinase) family peptidase
VPQVFLAFNTPPVSDRGEPHTGEHLLLGKGTKGKALSLEQDLSLVESTAWTSQTDVCYSWSCSAGKETFYRSVEQYLDALLLPDYSDEEIRREVCHIGPVRDPATGEISVDEQGTIYQEIAGTSGKPCRSASGVPTIRSP